MDRTTESFLIVQAGSLRCALPLSQVREVMRALPVKQASGLPPGVLGASVIRGEPLPVVSLARLLHQTDVQETRFVVLRTPGRDCVLAVGSVESITSIESSAWQQMPKLLERLDGAEEIAACDQDLIVSLDTARVVAALPVEWPA